MDMKEFDEIRPYETGEMKQAFEDLLNDRQFAHLLKGPVPWLPKALRNGFFRWAFRGVQSPLDFQKRFMKRIPMVARSTSVCCLVISVSAIRS